MNRASWAFVLAGVLGCSVAPVCLAQDTFMDKTVEHWVAALKGDDETLRDAAPWALMQLTPASIPQVIKALKDEDAQVRRGAAEALGLIGPRDERCVPALLSALADQDDEVIQIAATALARSGEAARPAVPALAALLEHPEDEVQIAAARALGELGEVAAEAVAGLSKVMGGGQPDLRLTAVESLFRITDDAALVMPTLLELMALDEAVMDEEEEADAEDPPRQRKWEDEDDEEEDIFWPPAVLKEMGEPAAVAAGALLADADPVTRRWAAEALIWLRDVAKGNLPQLVASLTDADETVRSRAVHALAKIASAYNEAAIEAGDEGDPDMASLMEPIADMVGDKATDVQEAALAALLEIDPADATTWRAVTDALSNAKPEVRIAAVKCLVVLKGDTDEVLACLESALRDAAPAVRRTAAEAVMGLRSVEGVEEVLLPTLYVGLDDDDLGVQVACAFAAGNIARDMGSMDSILVAGLACQETITRRSAIGGLGLLRSWRGEEGGPAGTEALARCLAEDEDEKVRIAAAAVLGLGDPEGTVAVAALVKALRDESEYVRIIAAKALHDLGTEAIQAAAGLVAALGDESAGLRAWAALALGTIEPEPATAVPTLVAALKDEDRRVIVNAAWALGELGERASEAVPALIQALSAPLGSRYAEREASKGSLGLHRYVGEALQQITGEGAAALISALRTEASAVRAGAAWALGTMQDADDAALDALKQAMAQADERVQYEAGRALNGRLYDKTVIVPVFVQLLGSEDAELRMGAAAELGAMEQQARGALPDLLRLTTDPVGDVRTMAMHALGAIGGPAEQLVPPLMKALHDPDLVVRASACWALEKLGSASAPAVPLLVSLLDDPNYEDMRSRLMSCFRAIGPEARAAVPSLLRVLAGDETSACMWAAYALGQIGEPVGEIVPALIRALDESEREGTADYAAQALAELGPKALDALPRPLELARTGSDEIKKSAVRAIGEIAPDALPDLVAQLAQEDPEALYGLVWTLAYSDETGAIIPSLVGMVEADDPTTRAWGMRLLAYLGPAGSPGVPALIEALSDNDPRIVGTALTALTYLGPSAAPAATAIAGLLGDENPNVSTRACMALAAIGPTAAGAAPALMAVIADQGADVNLRVGAVAALGAIHAQAEAAVPLLLSQLRRAGATLAPHIVTALGAYGKEAAQAAEAIRTRLDDGDASEKLRAAYALWQVTGDAGPMVGTGLGVLADDEGYAFDQAACIALAKVGQDAAEATARIRELLAEARAPYSLLFAALLGRFEGEIEVALEPICRDLKRSRASLAGHSAVTYGLPNMLAEFGADAVPRLTALLKDCTETMRLLAIRTLDYIGAPASPSIPALREIVDRKSTSEEEAEAAKQAVSTIQRAE